MLTGIGRLNWVHTQSKLRRVYLLGHQLTPAMSWSSRVGESADEVAIAGVQLGPLGGDLPGPRAPLAPAGDEGPQRRGRRVALESIAPEVALAGQVVRQVDV